MPNIILTKNLDSAQAIFFLQHKGGNIEIDELNPDKYKIIEDPLETLSKNSLIEENEKDKVKIKTYIENLLSKLPNNVGHKIFIKDIFTGMLEIKSYNQSILNNTLDLVLDLSKGFEIDGSWKECTTPPTWHTKLKFNLFFLFSN